MESTPQKSFLAQFYNYGKQFEYEVGEEGEQENREMTADEIMALTQTLNEKEIEEISPDQIEQKFEGKITPSDLQDSKISTIITLSIAPKFEESFVKFQILDLVANNLIHMRALPTIELTLCLPTSYPSRSPPLILQTNKFYEEVLPINDYIYEKLSEKWAEEMPVLYEMAIYL